MSFFKKIFRCNCPVTSALDIVGDKWTLVIVKHMLFEYKKTFKDFSESEESIAPNILSARLKDLEKFEFIKKTNHPNNKKTKIYLLTQKGLTLTPIIFSLAKWSYENIRKSSHPFFDELSSQKKDINELHQEIIDAYKKKAVIT